MDRLRAASLAMLFVVNLLTIACAGSEEELPFGLKSETVVSADRPTVMAFAPDGRIFFGEQYTGFIRVIRADGTLQEQPLAQVPTTTVVGQDWGLTGLALDPAFATNHFLYAFYTEPVTAAPAPTDVSASPGVSPAAAAGPVAKPKLVRFTERDGVGVDQAVITDQFPVTSPAHPDFNANGNIHFGPDGFLYLSLGDYDIFGEERDRLTSLSNPIGKILRIDAATGQAAPDNPFAGTADADARIFAIGFREPFDFVFHTESGQIYGTDNTTVSCEELNIIQKGGNYGWPNVGEFPWSDCFAGEQVRPIHFFTKEGGSPGEFLGSFVEVSGLDFVTGEKYPDLSGSLVVCELGTSVLRRVALGGPNLDQVTDNDVIAKDCKRDVAVGPDGTVYYAAEGEIRRLVPGRAADTSSSSPAPPVVRRN